MEKNTKQVKNMQKKIYEKKEPEEKLKYRKKFAGYYWDGKKEYKLYDREPL